MRIFKTFNPENDLLRKYISYYYLDIATSDDYVNEYVCYPHFNNTISLYKSHVSNFSSQHSQITYKKETAPLQIFTPLREQILKVTQRGPVHKVAIVFNPLGIQQFFKQIPIQKETIALDFFTSDQLNTIFHTLDEEHISLLLDSYLSEKYQRIENPYLEKAIELFHQHTDDLSIEYLAENILGISRKQLNRQFQKYIGTSAQKYRSIVRFRQLMDHKLQYQEQQNLTSLSHQAHYTDQSHFIKSCRQLTGLAPKQFFSDGQLIGSKDTFWNFTAK